MNNHLQRALTWATTLLGQDQCEYTQIVHTPYSQVTKITTANASYYLKITPPALALEAKLITVLQDNFAAPVPLIVGSNPDLSCFLMHDAGVSLRSILKQDFDHQLLCQAIAQFSALQVKLMPYIDTFIRLGVPDWRLTHFPILLYQDILNNPELLLADGVTAAEISTLSSFIPSITALVAKLSSYGIPESIVQPDFNDNNTLVNTSNSKFTFIDLGELAISHPFFSLLNCLHQARKHYQLSTQDASYIKMKEAGVNQYRSFASDAQLLAALRVTQALEPVYGLLATQRLMQACDLDQILSWQAVKLRAMIQAFMRSFPSIDLPP